MASDPSVRASADRSPAAATAFATVAAAAAFRFRALRAAAVDFLDRIDFRPRAERVDSVPVPLVAREAEREGREAGADRAESGVVPDAA